MNRSISTFCAFRLGDNLCHLHFLRRLALAYPEYEFKHYLHQPYFEACRDLIIGAPNLRLSILQRHAALWTNDRPLDPSSFNSWKGIDGFWHNHPDKLDWVKFSLDWFRWLATKMGLDSPIFSPGDLLFDYERLRSPAEGQIHADFLIVNAPPQSGQVPGLDIDHLDRIACSLAKRFQVVVTNDSPRSKQLLCTQRLGWSVTDIGRLSQCVKYIVMVSTGPSWPTFNVWNQHTLARRFIILGSETINLPLANGFTHHCTSTAQLELALRASGLLTNEL